MAFEMARARGKPEAFTDRENAAMRHVLRTLAKRNRWTQAQAGAQVGVGQQTAGKLLGTQRAGFSRPTAVRLAELCGFDSPETMLRDLGASPDGSRVQAEWVLRELAVGAARRLGYDDAAIERVVTRYTESRYASVSARWWMDRIVHEAEQLAAEKAAPAPASSPALPVEKKAGRRRKAAHG